MDLLRKIRDFLAEVKIELMPEGQIGVNWPREGKRTLGEGSACARPCGGRGGAWLEQGETEGHPGERQIRRAHGGWRQGPWNHLKGSAVSWEQQENSDVFSWGTRGD